MPSSGTVPWRRSDHTVMSSSEINRASAPTTIRITPAVWRSMPAKCAVTANFRIAPSAIRNIDVPMYMRFAYPRQAEPTRNRLWLGSVLEEVEHRRVRRARRLELGDVAAVELEVSRGRQRLLHVPHEAVRHERVVASPD